MCLLVAISTSGLLRKLVVIVLHNVCDNARIITPLDRETARTGSGLATLLTLYEAVNLFPAFGVARCHAWCWIQVSRTAMLLVASSPALRNRTNLSILPVVKRLAVEFVIVAKRIVTSTTRNAELGVSLLLSGQTSTSETSGSTDKLQVTKPIRVLSRLKCPSGAERRLALTV